MLNNHLKQQIIDTLNHGHSVSLVSSDGVELEALLKIPRISHHLIEIPRKISLLKDLRALLKLYRYFRQERFDIVHSVTPKAGLLSAIASYLAFTPIRLHTFTGQPWAELKGVIRFVAKLSDWLIVQLNTCTYADSNSQKYFLVDQRVALEEKIKVISFGSLAGINLKRFNPELWSASSPQIRRELKISSTAQVITFIGRMVQDKGVVEMVEAFVKLQKAHRECILLLIGPEEQEVLPKETLEIIRTNPSVISIGYSQQPEKYLSISTLLCLPSYREGFGNVVIEAAAMGVPAVGSDIVGLRDAIVDGETGMLIEVKNSIALAEMLMDLLSDLSKLKKLGVQARQRTQKYFDAEIVNAAVILEYESLAISKGLI
jgi:glycosyltransferase involved in cell wall biosynthesis